LETLECILLLNLAYCKLNLIYDKNFGTLNPNHEVLKRFRILNYN